MKVIFSGSIPYNVVSGGGNTIRGLAGVDNGILVSTALLNSIELDEKTGLVRVGAGCYWGAVFAYLEKRGLTAVGARAPSVGVSGFLLGGRDLFRRSIWHRLIVHRRYLIPDKPLRAWVRLC